MTTIDQVSPVRQRDDRYGDDYADVNAMFAELAALSVDSPPWHRQRERIVRRCLPMADHVARHFDRRGEALDDLTQVARLGLVNAVDRFDVERGASFIAFAIPTMMGEVRRHFRDHAWTMHVPRRIRDLHVQINRARTDLTQELGRAPTATELSGTLGVDHDTVVECLVASDAYQLRSLDAPTSADDSQPQYVADTLGVHDERIDRVVDRVAVRPLLERLPTLERDVLHMRFFDGLTQSQIARRIGTSQMQVSRILSRTLAALRDELD